MDQQRRTALHLLTLLGAMQVGVTHASFSRNKQLAHRWGTKMPVLFIGHGVPLNAVRQSGYSEALKALGQQLPQPLAILVISPHWITESTTAIQASEQPVFLQAPTNHPELADFEYSPPGSPQVAQATHTLLGDYSSLRTDWGIDYGAWAVLASLYPAPNVPVFQISLDIYKQAPYHYALGKRLALLRDHNILIIGSGNLVSPDKIDARAPFLSTGALAPWAADFDREVWQAVKDRNLDALYNYHLLTGAKQAMPNPDHLWPLLYVLGAAHESKKSPSILYQGFQFGTIGMRSFLFKD